MGMEWMGPADLTGATNVRASHGVSVERLGELEADREEGGFEYWVAGRSTSIW